MLNKLWRYRYKTPPPTLLVLFRDVVVAELIEFADAAGYLFRYYPAFHEKNLTPFPGLPPGKDLLFDKLPTFFEERLPDMRRPEIRELVRKSGVSETDKMRLLAVLGSHSVTDPFELRLKAIA